MRPVAVYSALRLGLFLLTLLVLRVLGVGGLLSLVIALVVAMLLSFLVLRRQRDAVTRALMERKRAQAAADGRDTPAGPDGPTDPPPRPARSRWSFSGRLAEDAAVEDAAVDGTRVDGTRVDGTRVDGTRRTDNPGGGTR